MDSCAREGKPVVFVDVHQPTPRKPEMQVTDMNIEKSLDHSEDGNGHGTPNNNTHEQPMVDDRKPVSPCEENRFNCVDLNLPNSGKTRMQVPGVNTEECQSRTTDTRDESLSHNTDDHPVVECHNSTSSFEKNTSHLCRRTSTFPREATDTDC